MFRTTLVATALGAAALSAQSGSRASRGQDDLFRIDTTVAFDKRGGVSLTLSSGEIIRRAWNRDEVRVRAHSERNTIRMEATASRLTLDLSRPRYGDTRYEVMVPAGVRVNARATQGDIAVNGTKGGIDVYSQNGDITIEDVSELVEAGTLSGDIAVKGVTGRVSVRTTSGEVGVTDVKGDVEVTSVSGDVVLRNIAARNVRGKSTSGDISFEGVVDSTGWYDLGSHSGTVYVVIPPGTGAQLTVATYTGSIDSEFPITLRPGEHGIGASKRITFDIGKGDARINAESFSGDVIIRTRARTPRDR